MLIDATGRRAVSLRAMGGTHHFDDCQTLIWARFCLPSTSLGHSTWLEAAPSGWWYAALPSTTLIAPRLKQARLQPESFQITASRSYRAARVVGENWQTVGDAACAFDPLSSAGIFKALVNGQDAARAICDEAAGSHAKRIHQDYETYLIKRAELYQAEQRWAEMPFWALLAAAQGAQGSVNLA
jgi:hypothetical protein